VKCNGRAAREPRAGRLPPRILEPWLPSHAGEDQIFGPEERHECNGDVGNVTFPCGYTVAADGDTLRIYYAAADSSIALATASIRDLLRWLDEHGQTPDVVRLRRDSVAPKPTSISSEMRALPGRALVCSRGTPPGRLPAWPRSAWPDLVHVKLASARVSLSFTALASSASFG
jgi:hypothetical protein